MTAAKLRWSREPDGYRSGPFFCQRHHVDDREFDGGYVHTYWNLLVDGEPYQQHTDLASAKRDAERLAARREAAV